MIDYSAKVFQKNKQKDSITVDYMMNIAVKYFSIMKINEAGDYVGKVCVGLNDIKKTEKKRSAFIEAFCFSTIFKHYQGKEFNMYDKFVSGIKALYTLNLGIDTTERLLRAQGAMYMYMSQNKNLKKMLLFEYAKNKEILPFILKD
jgi:hypothetical protein